MKSRLFLLTIILTLPLAVFAQDDAVVEEAVWGEVGTPVSYTHLTLPTKA